MEITLTQVICWINVILIDKFCFLCCFLFKFIEKLHMNLPFVVFKQTSCSKCAFSHKHISLHRLMNNIYNYLTLSFKELIGGRYFEIRKQFVSHYELFTIKNSGCYSDFEIPLSRAWNTSVWDKYHSSQPIKLQDFIEPCYNHMNFISVARAHPYRFF